MKSLFALFFVLLHLITMAQPPVKPEDYGLQAYEINDDSLGTIKFYLTKNGSDKVKPLLIYLDGSGCYPLALYIKQEKGSMVSNTIEREMLKLADRFHIVLISKPGLNFCDTIQTNITDMNRIMNELYQPKDEYNKKLDLAWRVRSASLVIDYLCGKIPVDKKKVIAYGYSEGAQVAPALAFANKKVTHAICIAGNGPSQFFDFVAAIRSDAAKGVITQEEGQKQIDSLETIFADIYAHPDAVDKFWLGHTYKRWASFCKSPPIDYLVQLDIPVFIAKGTNDENSVIYGYDLVPLEFLRLNKKNLTYKVFPGNDHYFMQTIQQDGVTKTVSNKDKLYSTMLNWFDTH